MKNLYLLAALLLPISVYAEIPAGYYDDLKGINTPEALKTAVYTLVSPHSHPNGADAYETYYYDGLKRYFQTTDVYPDDNRRWWDMYSDIPRYVPSFSGMNREHSFPKSWWGGDTDIPAYVDLYHLYPSDATANQAKSNYPLGDVNRGEKVHFDNGVSTVGYAVAGQGGGANRVFEPADEYKGDFARTYMYVVTIYQNLTWNPNYMYMLQQNTYPTLKPWASQLMLEWARQDPVSQKEIERNEAVYRIQNNRNPFIDMPDLMEYIWGTKMGQSFTPPTTGGGGASGQPQLFSPVDGMALDFGEVAAGATLQRQLLFSGENLTGNISVIVTGRDRAMFSVETTTISTSLINSSTGYYLTVNYTPAEIGEHEAALTVYDVTGWGAGSLNVSLHGEGEGVPTLSQLKALPATDVTDDSYVARWEEPAEVVDYYVVNRTHYVDGTAVTEELVADENFLLVEGYDPAEYDSYTVQSVRLGYRSVPSNAIIVARGGIDGVNVGEPLTVEVYPGLVRILCGEPQHDARILDLTGRTFMTLPIISRNDELMLPAGAWLLTTREHPAGVKILVR